MMTSKLQGYSDRECRNPEYGGDVFMRTPSLVAKQKCLKLPED
jgi:hypothetical protein